MRRCNAHLFARLDIFVRIVAFALALCLGLVATAVSTSLPGWAKDALEDSKHVEIDPRATSLTLVNDVEIKYDKSIRAELKYRVAFKTLAPTRVGSKEHGIQLRPTSWLEDFKLWYDIPGERPKEFNEEVLLYSSAISSSVGEYDDERIAFFGLKELPIGSVVAYEFKRIDTGQIGIFSDEIPIRDSQPLVNLSISVEIPDGWEIFYTLRHADFLTYKQEGGKHIWSAKHLTYEPTEPYSPGWMFLAPRLYVSCANPANPDISDSTLWRVGHFTSWKSVIHWVCRLTDSLAEPSTRAQAIADSLKSQAKSDDELKSMLAEYVQENIRYVAVEIGDGRFVPRDDSVTLALGYGDCKDMTTLARALFKAAGFKTAATLTNINRLMNPLIPSPYAFNHCIMAISTSDTGSAVTESVVSEENIQNAVNWIFFDPTDSHTRFGNVSPYLLGEKVLIGDTTTEDILRIPNAVGAAYRVEKHIDASFDSAGSAEATVTIITYGGSSWRERTVESRITESLYEETIEADLKKSSPSAKVKLQSRTCDHDSCVIVYSVHVDNYAVAVDRVYYLQPDITASRTKNLLTAETRTLPIWFGPSASLNVTAKWRLPTDFEVAENPVDIYFSGKSGEAITQLTWTDSLSFTFTATKNIFGNVLQADDYAEAQRFEKSVRAIGIQVIGLTRIEK